MRIPILIAAALIAAAAFAASASAGDGPRTMTLSTPFDGGHSGHVDIGKRGFSPGDMFTVTGQPVSDETTGHRVGRLDAIETVVSRRHDGTTSMAATLRLADGTLHGTGIIRHTDTPPRLPVTGGTGTYAGARGQLTITEDDARKLTIMRLELVSKPTAWISAARPSGPDQGPPASCARIQVRRGPSRGAAHRLVRATGRSRRPPAR